MRGEPTFNEQMVTKRQALLLANPGAEVISVDGTSTTFVDLQTRLNWFQSQVAREQGTKPMSAGIRLGGFTP
jgi:hypothetical protein